MIIKQVPSKLYNKQFRFTSVTMNCYTDFITNRTDVTCIYKCLLSQSTPLTVELNKISEKVKQSILHASFPRIYGAELYHQYVDRCSGTERWWNISLYNIGYEIRNVDMVFCILIIPNMYWSITFLSKWPANSRETSRLIFLVDMDGQLVQYKIVSYQ